MMTYQLYGDPRSGSCAVECALAEAGAACRVVEVDLAREQQLDPSYAALNPARKIPALALPGGQLVTESAAILIVVAEREAQAGLLPPPGTPERNDALRWLLYVSSEIYPQIEIADYPERFVPDPALAERVKEMARERLRARWAPIEHAATDHGTMLASGFSALDLYIATLSRWEIGDDWRSANLPRVEAIAHAVAARPLAGPVFRRHFG